MLAPRAVRRRQEQFLEQVPKARVLEGGAGERRFRAALPPRTDAHSRSGPVELEQKQTGVSAERKCG